MGGSFNKITKLRLFDAVAINNSTVTSIDIPLTTIASNGIMSIQYDLSDSTGSPNVDLKYLLSIDEKNWITPSTASNIATTLLKTSGTSGIDIITFSVEPAMSMRITATETATSAGIITLDIIVQ